MRPLFGGVLIILAVVAAGFVAERLFGPDSDPMSDAREAIVELPHDVRLREASEGVLVGMVRGRGGAVVHFAASESAPDEPSDIPPHLIHFDRSPSRAGSFTVWEDSEVRRPGETSVELREREEIAVELEEALDR
jgi:hypothetical protein